MQPQLHRKSLVTYSKEKPTGFVSQNRWLTGENAPLSASFLHSFPPRLALKSIPGRARQKFSP